MTQRRDVNKGEAKHSYLCGLAWEPLSGMVLGLVPYGCWS